MAKERASKVDGQPKKEKKRSTEDKIKKHKRKEKTAHESYDSDGDLGMTTEETSIAAENALKQATHATQPAVHHFELPLIPKKKEKRVPANIDEVEVAGTDEPLPEPTEEVVPESRRAKKLKRKEQALQEELQKQMIGQEPNSSIAESDLHLESDKTRKSKKKVEKKAAGQPPSGQPGASATEQTVDSEEVPLFAIDLAPTKVDLEKLKAEALQAEDTPMGDGDSQSALNRADRRRLAMIEKQRTAIVKALGLPSDSNEQNDEVKARLDGWITHLDEKTAERQERRRVKRAKEAARIRSKRGKLLTGRKLVDKRKDMKKMQRRKPRQLSRQ